MSSFLLAKMRPTEDAVTGLLVDLLRAWPEPNVVATLFRSAVAHEGGTWVVPDFDELRVAPWPGWQSGEPDVVLSLVQGGREVLHIVLEAKLGASKSSVDDAEEPVGAEEQTRDQLAKYQREASRQFPGVAVIVLYVTHHATMPRDDLSQSFKRFDAKNDQGTVPRLAWLGWRDVRDALVALSALRCDRAFSAYALGFAQVLRAVGQYHFTGAWIAPRAAAAPAPQRIWWRTAAPEPVARAYSWGRSTDRAVGAPPRSLWMKRDAAYRWTRPTRLLPIVATYRSQQ